MNLGFMEDNIPNRFSNVRSVTIPINTSWNPSKVHEGPITEPDMELKEIIEQEEKHTEKPYIANESIIITLDNLKNILEKYIEELENRVKLPQKSLFGKPTGKLNEKNSASVHKIIDDLKHILNEKYIEDLLNKFGDIFIQAKNLMKKIGSNNSYFKRMTRSKSWRKYPRVGKMFELVRLPSAKLAYTLITVVTIQNEKKEDIVPGIRFFMTEAYNYVNKGNMYNYSNWYGGKHNKPKGRKTYKK